MVRQRSWRFWTTGGGDDGRVDDEGGGGDDVRKNRLLMKVVMKDIFEGGYGRWMGDQYGVVDCGLNGDGIGRRRGERGREAWVVL